MSKILPTIQQRIQRIQAEIKADKMLVMPDRWHIDFMADLVRRDIAFGSPKQNAVVSEIERMVFGNPAGLIESLCKEIEAP